MLKSVDQIDVLCWSETDGGILNKHTWGKQFYTVVGLDVRRSFKDTHSNYCVYQKTAKVNHPIQTANINFIRSYSTSVCTTPL